MLIDDLQSQLRDTRHAVEHIRESVAELRLSVEELRRTCANGRWWTCEPPGRAGACGELLLDQRSGASRPGQEWWYFFTLDSKCSSSKIQRCSFIALSCQPRDRSAIPTAVRCYSNTSVRVVSALLSASHLDLIRWVLRRAPVQPRGSVGPLREVRLKADTTFRAAAR